MTTQTGDAAKSIAANVQNKARSAYAKSSAAVGEIGGITKGNVEAVVTSGKILGAGFKELSEGSIAESKQAVDTLVADLKAIAAVKSPSEFFYLQLKLLKRNFDSAIALTEKNSQALGKLASVAALPITAQVKANVTKWRQVV